MSKTLTETLGAFVAETNFNSLPARVVERAKISLIHNLSVALAGRSRETVARRISERFYALPAEATLLANGKKVSAEGAAFANGALMHARSQDDTQPASSSHPGAPVIPAALALAESFEASGPEFLTAVVLGYEVLCRVGRDFDYLVTKRGFRSAVVIGGFGAAAAAAKLMRLSAEETGHALGLVTHMAGGLAQVWTEGSPEFPLQLGIAARNGIFAARAAKEGMRAARETLEGKNGFYRAYAGADQPPLEALSGLGRDWQLEEVTVKAFPACAILQGPMELMLKLKRMHGLEPANIERIRLELSPYEGDYPGIDNAGPTFPSATATKMSAQFCLSVGVLDGRLKLTDLGRLDDPDITAGARKVEVIRNADLADRLCRITVTSKDGREISGTIDTPVGQPDFAGIHQFALTLAPEMQLAPDAVEKLVDGVAALDQTASLAALTAAASIQPEA